MDILVAYYSRFGNTQKIAQTLAAVLGEAGQVRLVPLEQLAPADFDSVGLVVMGCPTYRMKLPEEVRAAFECLPRRLLWRTPAAAFDTSYRMSAWLEPFTAAHRLVQKLRRMGGKLVLPAQSFHVVERQGPLYEGEIERAQAWARSILAQLRAV